MKLEIIMQWIYQHYKIITGIFVPVIVAFIGLFKLQSQNNKTITAKGEKHTQLQTGGDIKGSQIAGSHAMQNKAGRDLIVCATTDMSSLESMARGFIDTMFPHTQQAFNTIRTNTFAFLKDFEAIFKTLSLDEKGKFSEPEVQIALQNVIKAAARSTNPDMYSFLAKLIADRVQKPKTNIAELAINEAIEVAAKLDANLIKILSLSFMFTKTKYLSLSDKRELFNKLSLCVEKFSEISSSASKFEYLESISCGKTIQIISSNLINIILNNYPHLFLKNIEKKKIDQLSLPDNIRSQCFKKINDDLFEFRTIIGLYLFENQTLRNIGDNEQIFFPDQIKEKLKTMCTQNKLSPKEIEVLLCQEISGFTNLLEVWNKNGFAQFSLTAIGIVIGHTYLEQANFGNFDLNIWIN